MSRFRRGGAIRIAFVAAAVAVLAVSANAVAVRAAAAPPTLPPIPRCSWPLKVGVDADNIQLPDATATYWSFPFPLRDGMQLTINGVYPDARYMSFNVYTADGSEFTENGVSSSLSDYQIKPDDGSVNPWRSKAAPGGKFTVTVGNDVQPGDVNALPIAPDGTPAGVKATVMFRVYLPTGGDASVTLPTVTITLDGTSTTIPSCPIATPSPDPTPTPTPTIPPSGSGPTEEPPFIHSSAVIGTAHPNADNAYLSTNITPPAPGDVVVIRGRAPRSATGTHPAFWPARKADVRYWSMCNNSTDDSLNYPLIINPLPDGSQDDGCRYDDNTALDAAGYYTYVMGTEDERSTIDGIRNATFLPLAMNDADATQMLMLRNLLPVDLTVDKFKQAIQNVPMDSTPDVAQQIMGQYYPQITVCSLAGLAKYGVNHCNFSR
jgi:hypothetical protein